MAGAQELTEYVQNLRALLAQDEVRFGLMVDRQVQFALLKTLNGTRAVLEPGLWELLIVCVEGPNAAAPLCDDAQFAAAAEAVSAGKNFAGSGTTRFINAARAVVAALTTLRECGVYPRPRIRGP